MRKLMWFAVGFGCACAVCAYFPNWWALPPMAGVLALGLCRWSGSRRLFYGALCVALGCALGTAHFLLFDTLHLSAAKQADTQKLRAVITAHDYSFAREGGVAGDGKVELEGKTYRVRYYLYEDTQIAPGDTLTGTFSFRLTTPDASKGATYHSGSGIFLLAYAGGDVTVARADSVPWQDYPSLLRKALSDQINALFPPDTAPFACGILLGDDSQLDYRTDTALSVSGVRHIVAVSGLHVSILCALLMALTLRRRTLACLLGLPLLALFAAVAGFTPSVVRACISSALMLIAALCMREFDAPTALAASAVIMLAYNPWVITSVSFQLSVGSVSGILLFCEKINDWLTERLIRKKYGRVRKRILAAFCASVAMSLSAVSISTPLVAWHFGVVSLVSVLSNLLVVWAITFIFAGILAACALGAVWLPAGSALAGIVSWLIRYVAGTARMLASFPLAAVYTCSAFIAAWLVAVYAMLAVFAIRRIKRPGLFASCAALALCVALLLSWLTPLADTYSVTVLDVGQGQCILLQSKGRVYMVDCGGDYDAAAADTAAQTLMSQGIFRLDGLILTHFDRDHIGGAEYLLQRIPADSIFLPQGWEGRFSPQGAVIPVVRDMHLSAGSAEIWLYAGDPSASDNDSGICVLYHTEKCDILITGDLSESGERALLERASLPHLTLLVAGHHGAKTSTSVRLLEATQPDCVAISVGANNAYGHPSDELLQRLAAFGCEILRTDTQGTIRIRG